eukprot:370297_1
MHVNLSCPNRNDKQMCPSLKRLAKQLIIHKRWVYTVYTKTKGEDSIDRTIEIDVDKFIDNNMFKRVFLESANGINRITKKQAESLTQLLDKQKIMNVNVFVKLNRKSFAKIIQNHTQILPAVGGKLYKKINNSLQKTAQTQQFGQFISDLDMTCINNDYHHILTWHIYKGDKESIQNAFMFFGTVIHYEDNPTDIEECRSYKRREQAKEEVKQKIEEANGNNSVDGDKNIWFLKQYYIRNQLDVIHSYLTHSDWRYFVQRVSDDNDEKKDNTSTRQSTTNNIRDTDKYITDSSPESTVASYGFGVDHSYPHSSFKYYSVRDELLCNSLWSISNKEFQISLTKALKLHTIALGNLYKNALICKYFHKWYNILRNEPIGIRHVFVIIIYSDLSDFCRTFRTTYRLIEKETNVQQVKERHEELYQYSRCLWEAVEFFGQCMDSKMKVYHGLNRVMLFDKFNAYFNQPVSTTQTFKVAAEFSQGRGIILALKARTKYCNDPKKIPKYLRIAFLSDFPTEDELLFHGAHVHFSIHDIIEAQYLKEHSEELVMLNTFQKMVQNEAIEWNDNKQTKNIIYALTILIKHDLQQETEENDEVKLKNQLPSSKYLTEYGQ